MAEKIDIKFPARTGRRGTMKESENAILTQQQAGNPGCGMGTENACFALTMGPRGTMRTDFKLDLALGARGIPVTCFHGMEE